MGELRVRGLEASDFEVLLALQHAGSGSAPGWSAAQLEQELTDPGRDGGRRVVIVADGERVRAGGGYVPAGREFFAAPTFAADVAAGVLLFETLAQRAAGADFVRASANDGEHAKRAALVHSGFRRTFAFVTVARAVVAADAARAVAAPGFRRVPVADVPLAVMRAVHNDAFRGVPNAPEQSLDEVAWSVAHLFAEGSGVWLDEDGAPGGYLWMMRGEDARGAHVTVDAVAVTAARRRSGLGLAMLAYGLAATAAAGVGEARALIASTNIASLALHRAAGFAEAWRRDVYQRDLVHE